MNTLVKITAVLLALTLLALPAAATVAEEGHGVLIVSTTTDGTVINMQYVSLDDHQEIPEHMELRPFFRDSDPEFTVIDAAADTGYPAESVIINRDSRHDFR